MDNVLSFITDNSVDLTIFLVIILFIGIGSYRGFLNYALRSCSRFITMAISFLLYPYISGVLRKTFVFDAISESVMKNLGLSNAVVGTQQQQIEAINSLQLPSPIKSMLLDNNNSVIYSLLNVKNGINDYIARFIANIILSIAVSIIVYVTISIAIRVFTNIADFIANLPVISLLNTFAGGVLGLVVGVIVVWVAFTIMNLFIANAFFQDLNNKIYVSHLGKYLYDNNVIWNLMKSNLFK